MGPRRASDRGTIMITIATDFSPVPAGRFVGDGPFSGEAFRETILRARLAAHDVVTVVLDGAAGYPSSFLEEAFGGLVRKGYFAAHDLRRKLKIEANTAGYGSYADAIWRYIDRAVPENRIH